MKNLVLEKLRVRSVYKHRAGKNVILIRSTFVF